MLRLNFFPASLGHLGWAGQPQTYQPQLNPHWNIRRKYNHYRFISNKLGILVKLQILVAEEAVMPYLNSCEACLSPSKQSRFVYKALWRRPANDEVHRTTEGLLVLTVQTKTPFFHWIRSAMPTHTKQDVCLQAQPLTGVLTPPKRMKHSPMNLRGDQHPDPAENKTRNLEGWRGLAEIKLRAGILWFSQRGDSADQKHPNLPSPRTLKVKK